MKDIKGYEGLYAVTEDGKVYSYRREKFLKPWEDRYGYLHVDLCNVTSKKHKLIHRLVAEAFIPKPNMLPEVNHKDENKKNNCVSNLEWCDAKYNVNFGTRNDRAGIAHRKPVVCVETGRIFDSATEACRRTGTLLSGISSCCNGKQKTAGSFHWSYVGGE